MNSSFESNPPGASSKSDIVESYNKTYVEELTDVYEKMDTIIIDDIKYYGLDEVNLMLGYKSIKDVLYRMMLADPNAVDHVKRVKIRPVRRLVIKTYVDIYIVEKLLLAYNARYKFGLHHKVFNLFGINPPLINKFDKYLNTKYKK